MKSFLLLLILLFVLAAGDCAPGCDSTMLSNGICDSECNNPACTYDFGDCSCAIGCLSYYNHSSKF